MIIGATYCGSENNNFTPQERYNLHVKAERGNITITKAITDDDEEKSYNSLSEFLESWDNIHPHGYDVDTGEGFEAFKNFVLRNTLGEEFFLKTIGTNINTWRQEKNMSAKTLSNLTGFNEDVILEIENGDFDFSIIKLQRIAHALNTTITHLLPRE